MITAREAADPNADLVVGDHVLRFEARDLDDIRALGGNEPEDERRFATVARLSEINLGLYRTMMQPVVKAMVGEPMAEWLRRMHPLRLQYELLSDRNPFLRGLADLAQEVRRQRQPAAADNALVQAEHVVSEQIEKALEGYAALRDQAQERLSSPPTARRCCRRWWASRPDELPPRRRPGDEPEHREFVARRAAELRSRIAEGGLGEAALRALVYVGLAERESDERTFNMLRRIRDERGSKVSLGTFKQALRDQFLMLLLDPQGALAALPKLLERAHAAEIRPMLEDVRRVVTAGGDLSAAGQERLQAIEAIFEKAAARATSGASAAEAVGEAAKVAAGGPDPRRPASTVERTPPRRRGLTGKGGGDEQRTASAGGSAQDRRGRGDGKAARGSGAQEEDREPRAGAARGLHDRRCAVRRHGPCQRRRAQCRPAESGELLALRFPAEYCLDKGRAINNGEPGGHRPCRGGRRRPSSSTRRISRTSATRSGPRS